MTEPILSGCDRRSAPLSGSDRAQTAGLREIIGEHIDFAAAQRLDRHLPAVNCALDQGHDQAPATVIDEVSARRDAPKVLAKMEFWRARTACKADWRFWRALRVRDMIELLVR